MFAQVPKQLLQEGEHKVFVYCKLYFLEFQKVEYSIKEFSKTTNLTYRQCRRLKELAQKQLKKEKK